MHVIRVRNVNAALPLGIEYLRANGVEAPSRNGPVLCSTEPVSTVYLCPTERVGFWPERDYNTAFLVYEALWMLAGRNDLPPLLDYVKTFSKYSDDGATLNGAYGFRWRKLFGFDQLTSAINTLRKDPTSRRVVVQMFDAVRDTFLSPNSADIPCNLILTFQINQATDCLDMTVFCRSNDLMWGAYFANAFHFSLLLEYVAVGVGKAVGTYTQVSVNYHLYKATTPDQITEHDRYRFGTVTAYPLQGNICDESPESLDRQIRTILEEQAHRSGLKPQSLDSPFLQAANDVLFAHYLYKLAGAEDAVSFLNYVNSQSDLCVSMLAWLTRRLPGQWTKDVLNGRHAWVKSKYHATECGYSGCLKTKDEHTP